MKRNYFYTYAVQKQDLDHSNHLNNAVYLKIFEAARWSMIQTNGLNGLDLQKQTNIAPVILDVYLKFKKEVRENDILQIQTTYTGYRTKIAKLNQIMSKNNIVCCIGNFTFGLFDLHSRALTIPPDNWLKALGLPPYAEVDDIVLT